MITNEEAKDKTAEGWMRVSAMIEVLAIKEEATKDALERLVTKLDNDSRVKLCNKTFLEAQKVEKPLKNVEVGYSQVVELEFVVKRFDDLAGVVVEYGPSAVEILEPRELKISAGELQTVLNSFSGLMHQYAAAKVGGMVFIKEKN